jgi:glutamyl-tRNA reductase
MSAASAAVALATALAGDLQLKTTLVVGAGQTGRQALARLAKQRPARLLVASRSAHHAETAAHTAGAEVVALDALGAILPDVDVVLVALTTPGHVLTADDVSARNARPLLIVDLSVPRAVDPEVGETAGVTLRSVDDLGEIATQSATRRAREVPRVEAIARDEARRAYAKLQRRLVLSQRSASRAQ